jgi:hypothetical protein
MMGERLVMQESLFYEFRLEDHVPCDHLLRRIDRFVDCSELRQHLAGFYSSMGRPSVDPELMIRMLLIGWAQDELLLAATAQNLRKLAKLVVSSGPQVMLPA